MKEIANLIISSQYISFVLFPIAAIALTVGYIKLRVKALLLFAIGMWLSVIGFFSLSFPVWVDYIYSTGGGSSISGSRWSDLSSFLSSLGILGEYVQLAAVVWLVIYMIKRPSEQ